MTIQDDKPVLRAIIEALGAELDELNTAIIDCKNNRWIDTASGKQLDGIGEIVVRDRLVPKAIAVRVFGFRHQPNTAGFGQARFLHYDESATESYILSDAEYRLALLMKVRQNSAVCTIEDTIESLKCVFNAPRVIVQEVGNANISIAIGKKLTDNEILLANAINLVVRAGGVGVKYRSSFIGAPFGFLGQPGVMGFGQGALAQQW